MPLFDFPEKDVEHIENIAYFPYFLSKEEHDYLFDKLKELPFEQRTIAIQGRKLLLPRLETWHGDKGLEYEYSGLRSISKPWSEELLYIKEKIESKIAIAFNSVFCNLYRNGNDSVGYHADDERSLGPQWPDHIVIGSVSLGSQRRFNIKRNSDKYTKSYDLKPGSLLVMYGDFQMRWKHTVPKSKKALGERINLTYRIIT